MQKMGWFGVIRGHSRSWAMPPFNRVHTTSYSTLIETMCLSFLPSVLWRCWLGGRKGIRPVKNRVVGYWRGYVSGVSCWLAYMSQLMPMPLTVSCFSKIQIGFTFLVRAHLGSPGKRAIKRLCVCVCVYLLPFSRCSRLFVKSRRFWPTPPAFGALVGGDPGRISRGSESPEN